MYSDEERQVAAASLIHYAYEKSGDNTLDMEPYILKDIAHILANRRPVGGNVALDLQCALTRRDNQLAKATELFQNMPLLMALCSDSATPAAKAYALGWQLEVNEFLEAK